MAVTKTDTAASVSAISDRKARASLLSVKLEEHHRRRHWHKVGPGVTQDTVRYESYWAASRTKLARHDLITILANDESWEMEACVEKVTQDGVVLSVRKVYKRDSIFHVGQMLEDGIQTQCIDGWWCVVRLKDNHPIIQGHATEASAIAQFRREQPRRVA